MSGTLVAQEARVTPLMSQDLADFPGKEGLMITVVYPPGSSDPIHHGFFLDSYMSQMTLCTAGLIQTKAVSAKGLPTSESVRCGQNHFEGRQEM